MPSILGDLRQPKPDPGVASADVGAVAGVTQASRPSGSLIFLLLFLGSLICPPEIGLRIAGINLPMYRAFLVVFTPICVVSVLFGGRKRIATDYLIIAVCVWVFISIATVTGLNRWQFIGLSVLEFAGPYFFARQFVRTTADLRQFYFAYFVVIVIIIPIAVMESFTGQYIVRDLARSIFGSNGIAAVPRAPRLGLDRATVSFEHPIHYGVFVASSMAILIYSARGLVTRLARGAASVVGTFFSLSSGSLIILVMQIGMIVWGLVFQRSPKRWRLFVIFSAIMYVVIDLISNRTPFHVLVTYASLRTASAYNRILIWQFGVENVEKRPFFGVGLGEWDRPPWMSSSMDNYWLLIAVRYGLPCIVFYGLGIALIARGVIKGKLSPDDAYLRTGYMITFAALIIGGATVHFWGSIGVLFLFYLGVGPVFFNNNDRPAAPEAGRQDAR